MTFFTKRVGDHDNLLTDGPEELMLELEYRRIARLERLLEDQSNRIDQYQKLLDEYLHMNSHNVRGPLVQILGLVSLLQSEGEADSKMQLLQLLQKASEGLDEAVHQVNDRLHTAKTDLSR